MNQENTYGFTCEPGIDPLFVELADGLPIPPGATQFAVQDAEVRFYKWGPGFSEGGRRLYRYVFGFGYERTASWRVPGELRELPAGVTKLKIFAH